MKYALLFLTFLACIQMNAENTHKNISTCTSIPDTVQLPKVFVIGDYETEYDLMTLKYPNSVLSACGDDVNQAFRLWMALLQDMQIFAEKTHFELNGAKFWLNTFFAEDGSIDYMAYYLKPNSRNISEKDMKTFLESFMSQHKIAKNNKSGFAHYGHVSFPILPENISN